MSNSETAASNTFTLPVILLCVACLVLSCLFLAIDLSIPLGVAGGVPYVAVVLLSLRTRQAAITFMMATLCSVLTITGFFLSPQGEQLGLVLANRGLALFAIWTTAFLAISLLRETQTEIDTLRDILPICASCKDIRDDDGYWSQIEIYLEKHADTRFSHGICPDCREKLYPDIPFRADS